MTCVRRANFTYAAALIVCAELDGQSAMRPRPGALVESSRRSGLSQTSVSSRLLNHEPSYATRTMPRLFVHSAPTLKSFVRESYGSATSTSLLKPKLAPHGSSPVCLVVVNAALTSISLVGVARRRDSCRCLDAHEDRTGSRWARTR